MTTTLPINETRNGLTSHTIDVTSLPQVKSKWSNPRKHGWLLASKFLRWLCCVNDELLEQIELECSVRDAIRDAMVVHETGGGRQAVIDAMREVYDDTNYDLAGFEQAERERLEQEREKAALFQEQQREESMKRSRDGFYAMSEDDRLLFVCELRRVLSKRTLRIEDGNSEALHGVAATGDPATPVTEPVVVQKPKGRALIVPKFAASVVLALRAKFGKLAPHEANRLLIEREYLKLCRDTTVRNVDVELHRQWVINAFFNEGITDECATVRARVPRWLREAFGSVPNASPAIF